MTAPAAFDRRTHRYLRMPFSYPCNTDTAFEYLYNPRYLVNREGNPIQRIGV